MVTQTVRTGDLAHKTSMKILVIEDDREAADYLEKAFAEAGHNAHLARDGETGYTLARNGDYDVLIVDRMLPEIDGLTLVKTARGAGIRTPILFLTALGATEDRVEGLDAGADDYLVKPFAFTELAARLHALARRPPVLEAETVLRVGGLEMDVLRRVVTRDGRRVELQPREFRLLEYLLRNAGRVVTRTMLLEKVWDFHFDPQTSVVETHISRLRGKIDKGFDVPLLHTVRGAGYCFREPD
jgi:two-component system OmpR family response regulator